MMLKQTRHCKEERRTYEAGGGDDPLILEAGLLLEDTVGGDRPFDLKETLETELTRAR